MKINKTMRLPEELINKIKAKAEKENRSFANAMEVILIDYFAWQDAN